MIDYNFISHIPHTIKETLDNMYTYKLYLISKFIACYTKIINKINLYITSKVNNSYFSNFTISHMHSIQHISYLFKISSFIRIVLIG